MIPPHGVAHTILINTMFNDILPRRIDVQACSRRSVEGVLREALNQCFGDGPPALTSDLRFTIAAGGDGAARHYWVAHSGARPLLGERHEIVSLILGRLQDALDEWQWPLDYAETDPARSVHENAMRQRNRFVHRITLEVSTDVPLPKDASKLSIDQLDVLLADAFTTSRVVEASTSTQVFPTDISDHPGWGLAAAYNKTRAGRATERDWFRLGRERKAFSTAVFDALDIPQAFRVDMQRLSTTAMEMESGPKLDMYQQFMDRNQHFMRRISYYEEAQRLFRVPKAPAEKITLPLSEVAASPEYGVRFDLKRGVWEPLTERPATQVSMGALVAQDTCEICTEQHAHCAHVVTNNAKPTDEGEK